MGCAPMGSIRVMEVIADEKKLTVSFVRYGSDDATIRRFNKLMRSVQRSMKKFGNIEIRIKDIDWPKYDDS
jgi:hypothetical protein